MVAAPAFWSSTACDIVQARWARGGTTMTYPEEEK
jgi:hypothetical protein